jgi:hypothetical protein
MYYSAVAQWIGNSKIAPWFPDNLVYGSNGNTVYHNSRIDSRLYLYDANFNTINTVSIPSNIVSINRIYSHLNDTLYAWVINRSNFRTMPSIITNNLNSIKIIDSINGIALDNNFKDMLFYNARYGVVRTIRNGNFITTDGSVSWQNIDSSIYHFIQANRNNWFFGESSITTNNGFIAETNRTNNNNYLIYSYDYGQKVYEKQVPDFLSLSAVISPSKLVFTRTDSTLLNPKLIYFTNDTGTSFYRIDTFSSNINRVLFITPQDADSFLMALTTTGSFYLSKTDSTWRAFDNLNLFMVNIYNSQKGFAYNPDLTGDKFFTLSALPTSTIQQPKYNKQIKPYPNPASKFIYIDYPIAEIVAIDLKGSTTPLNVKFDDNSCDISSLYSGLYILKIKDKDGVWHHAKLLKQ